MLVPFVEGCFRGSDGFCHREIWIDALRGDDGHPCLQRAVIEPCVEDGGAQPLGGDAIAVGFGDAFDEAMESQATQIIGDAACGILARPVPEQWSEVLANILVGECAVDEEEQQHDVAERLNARVGEAKCRRRAGCRW